MIYARYERAKKALLEDQIIEERNYQNYIDHLIETAYFGRHEVWALKRIYPRTISKVSEARRKCSVDKIK